MANLISARGIPQVALADPAGQNVAILANVTDSVSGQPVAGVIVSFSTTIPYATFSSPTASTNAQGQAEVTLFYPILPPPGLSGAAVVPVTATIAGDSTTTFINFYNMGLTPIYLTNSTTSGELTFLSGAAISSGIQARITFPQNISYGDLITFFWESQSLQMFYTGGPLVWIIDINSAFNPTQALAQGDYIVWYFIQDILGNSSGSQPLFVRVSESPFTAPSLLPPTLPPALNSIINLADAQAGVTITVPILQQPQILLGDTLRVFLALRTLQGQLIRTIFYPRGRLQPPLANAVVPIPFSDLQNLSGVYGDFYYGITQNALVPPGNLISQVTRAYIDTVPPGF